MSVASSIRRIRKLNLGLVRELKYTILRTMLRMERPGATDGAFATAFATATARAQGMTLERFRELVEALATGRRELEADDPYLLVPIPIEPHAISGYGLTNGETTTVGTPAGRFSDCHEIWEIVSARSGWTHWFCPEVGFTRHEIAYGNSGSGGFDSFELVEYEIGR